METWKRKKYKRKPRVAATLELSFSIYSCWQFFTPFACTCGDRAVLYLFFFGFGYMGVMSLVAGVKWTRLGIHSGDSRPERLRDSRFPQYLRVLGQNIFIKILSDCSLIYISYLLLIPSATG